MSSTSVALAQFGVQLDRFRVCVFVGSRHYSGSCREHVT
jgi:hypothetical protein